MLQPYLDGDADNPTALGRLFRQERESIPPPALIALADGLLRAHKVRMATAVFEETLARTDDPDVAIWASFGLGWIALASGNPDGARRRFEVIVQDGDWGAATASALVTLANASNGAGQAAAAGFDAAAEQDGTSYQLRVTTRLLSGYAYYWAAQYAAAAQAFDRAVAEYPDTPLADDARYAAAWSRYRAGQRGPAIDELRALAGDGDAGGGAAPPALVTLTPDGVLGETLRHYRGAHLQSPDALLVQMLDLDGRALARAAVAVLDVPHAVPSPATAAPELAPPAPPSMVDPPQPKEEAVPAPADDRAAPEAQRGWRVPWLLLVLLVSAVVIATRRRRQAGVATAPLRNERR